LGNAQFKIVPILQTLTALKAGDLALSPLNGTVVVRVSNGSRGNNFPGGFDFDGFFARPEQVPLSVEQQSVRVLPLPQENVPPGFSGAIGNYSLSFSAGPTNVVAGDPITVKIQISGQGYLDGIAIPPLDWKDFKTFPATVKTETTDALGVQ